jgi:hypothetical protein
VPVQFSGSLREDLWRVAGVPGVGLAAGAKSLFVATCELAAAFGFGSTIGSASAGRWSAPGRSRSRSDRWDSGAVRIQGVLGGEGRQERVGGWVPRMVPG